MIRRGLLLEVLAPWPPHSHPLSPAPSTGWASDHGQRKPLGRRLQYEASMCQTVCAKETRAGYCQHLLHNHQRQAQVEPFWHQVLPSFQTASAEQTDHSWEHDLEKSHSRLSVHTKTSVCRWGREPRLQTCLPRLAWSLVCPQPTMRRTCTQVAVGPREL